MVRKILIAIVNSVLGDMIMPKYYIKCGSLEYIISTDKDALGAAMDSTFQLNDFDVLDEYFYVDERGFKNYVNAKPDTTVLNSTLVLKKAGWTIG